MGVPGAFFRRVKYSTNFQYILDYILIKETAVYRLSCLFTTVSSFVYSYLIFSLVYFTVSLSPENLPYRSVSLHTVLRLHFGTGIQSLRPGLGRQRRRR